MDLGLVKIATCFKSSVDQDVQNQSNQNQQDGIEGVGLQKSNQDIWMRGA